MVFDVSPAQTNKPLIKGLFLLERVVEAAATTNNI